MSRNLFRTLTLAATFSAVLAGHAALANSHMPQLKGKWVSVERGGYQFGTLTHGAPAKEPQSVRADKREWFLEIEEQDGIGVKGTWGGSPKREMILGAIRADGKSIVFADEDSYATGLLLSGTEMEYCVQETGKAIIAKCYLLKRQ